MQQDPETLALVPFNFENILDEVPELKKFGYRLDTYSFDPVIDSSDMHPSFWIDLANLINKQYDNYDGFVVLHGTDTMAFSASALSFMLKNLEKPVVFTGSQLPIGMLRTDGKENFISSIEIAAARRPDGHPFVPEVCVFFDSQLFRGNRCIKIHEENFTAFESPNYPALAQAGIHIKFNESVIHYPEHWGRKLKIHTEIDTNVAILKLFPGITPQYIDAVLNTDGVRAVILETFGAGNAPMSEMFLSRVKKCVDRGVVVVNVTQCAMGSVDMSAYANGVALKNIGVISGYDITTESALVKLFCFLGCYNDIETIKNRIMTNIRGEFSKND